MGRYREQTWELGCWSDYGEVWGTDSYIRVRMVVRLWGGTGNRDGVRMVVGYGEVRGTESYIRGRMLVRLWEVQGTDNYIGVRMVVRLWGGTGNRELY